MVSFTNQYTTTGWYQLFISFIFISTCLANYEPLNKDEMRCAGMYAKDVFPKLNQASVKLSLRGVVPEINQQNSDIKTHLAVAFMDFKDFDHLGIPATNNPMGERSYLCYNENIEDGSCPKDQLGHYHVVNPKDSSDFTLQTQFFEINQENKFEVETNYLVNKTGYICVTADLVAIDKDGKLLDEGLGPVMTFVGTIEWINPYGLLPAADHPKLTFYGTMSLIYLVVGIIWLIGCFKYWQDILPVQNYMSGVFLFLIVGMAANYGYLDNYNHIGISSYPFLAFVVILDAGRNSLCFFILLIVSLGYSVVKPTLGSTMRKCQLLTLIHFICGCLYGAGSMLTNPERAGIWILLFILPLSFTMTTFYVWIMQGMAATIAILESRKQYVKLTMYRHLRYVILGSIAILLLFFVFNSFFFHSYSDNAFINDQWQTRWFLVDGWLSLLFFAIFSGILYIWRPTENNQKYGLQELAQDEATADALDLEARMPPSEQNQGTGESDLDKGLPSHLDGGVNIFDIGGDEDDDKPASSSRH